MRSLPLPHNAWLLGLIVLLACVGGCGGENGDDRTSNGTGPADGKPDGGPPPPEPLLEGWEPPKATLLLTGQQIGFLEPCGCAPETQAGGIGRRFDLVQKIRERGWPLTALELGGTVHRSRRQSEIKFETLLAAYRDMGYSVLGLGPEELNLGAAMLLAQHATVGSPGEDDAAPLHFVCGNAVFFEDPDLEGGPLPHQFLRLNGVTIGVTQVVVDDERDPVFQEGATKDVSLQDAREKLPGLLEGLSAEDPDLKVLLSNATFETSRELAREFPGFDLVLSGGPEEPDPEPEFVEGAMLVSVGKKGKYAGVVGYYPEQEPKLRYECVHLDQHRFEETPEMHAHMAEYQRRLYREQIVATEPTIVHPREQDFVGAKRCGTCHTKAFAKWSESRHAHAFESLKHGHTEDGEHEEDWISRVYDPECLACHVTGWDPKTYLRYEGGFLNAEFLPEERKHRAELLAVQGCENCHGPGSRHTELEEQWEQDADAVPRDDLTAARKEMHLVAAEAEMQVCRKCHDGDNSPKFDFADYWEKVKHPWRD